MAYKLKGPLQITIPLGPEDEKKKKASLKGLNYDKVGAAVPPQSLLDKIGGFGSDTLRNTTDALTLGLYNKMLTATGLDPKAEEKLQQSQQDDPWAAVIGRTLGALPYGLGMSSLLGKTVPALGANTMPSIVGNNAVTGGSFSALDQFARHGNVDPLQLAEDTALSGGMGGLFHYGARAASPSARVRAKGTQLTPADKAAMTDLAVKGADSGIPLTVPEMAASVAPERSADIGVLSSVARQSPKGSAIASNFETARTPRIAAAGRRVVDALGPRIAPQEIQSAAGEGIADVTGGHQLAAQPYFDHAASRRVAPSNIPRSPFVTDAIQRTMDNEGLVYRVGQRIGGPVSPNHVGILSAALQAMRARAGAAFEGGHGDVGEAIHDAGDQLRNVIHRFAPTMQQGADIASAGRRAGAALENGPLGKLAASNTSKGQTSALLNSTTTPEADAAREAMQHMPGWAPRGVLGNAVDDAVSTNPSGWAHDILSTGHSRQLADDILGGSPSAPQLRNTLDAARAVSPKTTTPKSGMGLGWYQAMFNIARHYGQGSIEKMLQDPKTIKILGKMGPWQFLLSHMAESAARTSDAKRQGR